jgi:hypothetical protein
LASSIISDFWPWSIYTSFFSSTISVLNLSLFLIFSIVAEILLGDSPNETPSVDALDIITSFGIEHHENFEICKILILPRANSCMRQRHNNSSIWQMQHYSFRHSFCLPNVNQTYFFLNMNLLPINRKVYL